MDAGTSAGGTSVRQMATGAFRKSNETVINSAISVKGLIGISPSVFNAKKVKPGQDSSASRLNTAKKSPTHSPSLPFSNDSLHRLSWPTCTELDQDGEAFTMVS